MDRGHHQKQQYYNQRNQNVNETEYTKEIRIDVRSIKEQGYIKNR